MQTMLELSKNSLDNPMPDFDPAVLAKNQIIGDVDENDVANNTETI